MSYQRENKSTASLDGRGPWAEEECTSALLYVSFQVKQKPITVVVIVSPDEPEFNWSLNSATINRRARTWGIEIEIRKYGFGDYNKERKNRGTNKIPDSEEASGFFCAASARLSGDTRTLPYIKLWHLATCRILAWILGTGSQFAP